MNRGAPSSGGDSASRARTIRDIFVSDILIDIFELCSSVTLGRVSLLYKAAAADTWSLVPRIEFLDVVKDPYDTIIQYTGSFLRHIDLRTSRDYPAILAHVRDSCLGLGSLNLHGGLMVEFSHLDQDLASICSRITSLEIHGDDHRLNVNRLRDVLSCMREPCQITTLSLRISHDSPESRASWQEIMSALPRLRRIKTNLSASANLRDFFSTCHELEEIITHLANWQVGDWALYAAACIQELSDTKVGINIKFESESLLSRLLSALTPFESVKDIMTFLHKSGLRHPIHIDNVVDFLARLTTSRLHGEFIPFLRQIESGSASSLLPSVEQLASSPNLHLLWETVVHDLPAQTFLEVVEILGAPAVPQAPLLDAMLRRREWDGDYPRVLADLGLLNRIQDLSNDRRRDILLQAYSLGALQWLLENLTESDVRTMLLTRGATGPIPMRSVTGPLPLRLEICFVNSFENLVFISSFYNDPSLLSFEDPDEFIHVVKRMVSEYGDWKRYLQLILDATTMPKISAATRARWLFALMPFFSERVAFVPFCEELILSDSSVKPDYFGGIEEFAKVVDDHAEMASAILERLRPISASLLTQATSAERSKLEIFLTSLVELALQSTFRCPLPVQDMRFLLVDLFVPICRIYSNAFRTCTTSIVVSRAFSVAWELMDLDPIDGDPEIVGPLATALFSLAAGCHNPDATEQCSASIGKDLADILQQDRPVCLPKLVEACLGHLTTEEINAPRTDEGENLLDLILLQRHAQQFADVLSLISNLVARGARLSKDDSSTDGDESDFSQLYPPARFSPQCIEWYRHLRRVQKRAEKK
eukprot:TRINITY_DN3014_c0_g3_i1.p1 TRINITY_DN3014_c0_g3~~TRINITY_DN3014_c0_g3_i1.p1  ORF type:complete len:822 (+),score=107.99 TRINITY_DN3014_c0_g3_i1:173-2638(+)